ncbi:MAG: type II toxin-antitoxin system HicB family antitoxin [Planctomycetes bacterium]|nr:type II toxin-antitoxin system HicB family antitoxin [Planctomycetota bacterium]
MRLLVALRQGEDGYFIASCPALKGCHSQGRTKAEAVRNIREAIQGCLEALNARAQVTEDVEVREVRV